MGWTSWGVVSLEDMQVRGEGAQGGGCHGDLPMGWLHAGLRYWSPCFLPFLWDDYNCYTSLMSDEATDLLWPMKVKESTISQI